MSVTRRMIMSEVEDSVRRQRRGGVTVENWVDSRKAYIDLAAYMVLIVERGDRDAEDAEAAQNQGADRGGEETSGVRA